jgi:hypothetical protein
MKKIGKRRKISARIGKWETFNLKMKYALFKQKE